MMSARMLSFDPDFASPAEWAGMYRDLGIQVVPSFMPHERPNGWKRPLLSKWTELRENRVPDATFARWYGPNGDNAKRPNMGIIAGPASGNIVVIDLDVHKKPEAEQWWRGILHVHNQGTEPETWRQITGGGGRQLFFRARTDWHAPTNKTGIGVDIRGYGGFAVLPPSRHDSGKDYDWERGFAPYEVEIEDAPEWLLTEIEQLVARFGGDTSGRKVERTASVGDYDAWGHLKDGREDYMTRLVWATVLGMYRDCPIPPTEAEQVAAMDEAFTLYLRNVTSNHPGDQEEGLEREGRGQTLFAEKWRRAMKQWDGKVAEKAAEPRPNAEKPKPSPREPEIDPETGRPRPLIITAAEFVRSFKSPDYQIDGITQRSYLYGLTARTGHGKTAVGMFIAQCVARGLAIKKRGVRQGTVLYLAGENPDDIRARFMVLADHCGFDPDTIPIRFIAGIINIEVELPRIRAEAAEIPDLALVIVDTAAAYYVGDDGNSNVQQGAYARLLREFTFLPSKPATIVMTHPVKNAGKDNLLPVGGGAFLNEVDGNLTLWANAEKQTTLHWQGKFRGPEFEPITFRLDGATSDKVKDSDGRHMPSVVATPISDLELEVGEQKQMADEDVMLLAVADAPKASIAKLAHLSGWVGENGEPQKSKAYRTLRRLAEDKLVEVVRGKYRLTPKGKKEVGREDD